MTGERGRLARAGARAVDLADLWWRPENKLAKRDGVRIIATGLSICRADNQHADAVRTLLAAGVTVAAFANTMRSQNLTVDNLIDGVRVVPAGVAEPVRKQREGWAYLRP